jgi:hypothetical protein
MLSEDCNESVKKLGAILRKHKSLGTSQRRNWDRVRMACQDLDHVHELLNKRTSRLAAYVSVLGVSSQGRVEDELLPQILARMDNLAAQLRTGNATIQTGATSRTSRTSKTSQTSRSSRTSWTHYDDDDLTLWREFRHDLVKQGFRGRDIKQFSPALRTYVMRLQRRGMLDEEPLSKPIV